MSSGFDAHAFTHTLPFTAGAVLLVLVLTFLTARRAGRHSVVDTAWGLLFCAAAIATFVGSAGAGEPTRRWLLLAMTLLWGLRLTVHIARRNRGKGEDPRYTAMLAGHGTLYAVTVVYLLQGVLAYLVSMPVQVASFERSAPTPLMWIGVALWLTGIAFETIGDRQLARFKADPARSPILDTGLWRYTRHPNYFGDACVWVGIYCVAAGHWPGMLTFASPAVMIYLLAFGSGKRVLERSMADRPGYREYMRRTSGFIPLPPTRP